MDTPATTLRELALLFLRLGTTAFGGPAAHIAMMHDEVVRRRRWLSEEEFLDLLGATNLIPGPNSTEMAIHIGYVRRRWIGLVIAGVCFIAPAMLITAMFGWAYVRFGTVPTARWLLYGVKPVILSVVAQAIWTLTPKAARTLELRVLGLFAVVLAALGVHELAVLFVAAALSVIWARVRRRPTAAAVAPVTTLGALVNNLVGGAATVAVQPSLAGLFWVFLKTGSVLFGSGYVLLAFLRSDLVERLGWLTEGQLLDAIAIGQLTPGPVFTTATFIGYLVSGPAGAAVATVGIFLPAFIFVALSGPLVPKLRASSVAAAVLDGVNVASLALMAVVTVELGRAALVDVPAILLALCSLVLLVRYRVNSTWLVLAGAALGWMVHAISMR